ncbi:putative disease resistance protein RGA3 [Rosa rugosa]|uniref:putative disease resistance protein RGA3 n=1 Tax=Rosa rugosa TaxID=74645 RepID=UPI002B4047B0|nr:putative disease resistance protein RGA3 [Rosa rugosa]
MALDVAEFLWNKFLKSLAEMESELAGTITIPFFDSIKDLMKCFNEIKGVMNEIDIMPEPYTYSKTIDVLYKLNDALAECRVFTLECKELNKNVLSFYVPRIRFVGRMKSKVNDIKGELRMLADPEMGAPQEEIGNPPEKTEPKVLPKFFGFDNEAKGIEKLLVGGASSSSTRFTAIGVVGIAGAGKTTLVQQVLERGGVKEMFSTILWLPFYGIREGEQQFSKLGFETCILDKGGKSPDEKIVGLGKLLERLKQLLSGKRYLIVLDDVCHQHINIMERLVSGLPKESGGAVIVTSRLKEVAQKNIGEQQYLIPVEAQEDICSKIIEETIQSDEGLPMTKKEMKDQCHGLPLVAETLAHFIPQMV